MRPLSSSSISPRAKAHVSFLVFLVLMGASVVLFDASWQISIIPYYTDMPEPQQHSEHVVDIDIGIDSEIDIQGETETTTEVVRAKQKQQNANVTTTKTTTTTSMESIPPSKMSVHYHEMWNHTTSTIDVPEKYKNPFNFDVIGTDGVPPPLTSLEILQNVLHGDKYQAEFEAVEVYMKAIHNANARTKKNATATATASIPTCLAPDLAATRELANQVVEARRNRSTKRNTKQQQKQNDRWPYKELVLPLPVLNVGYPKVGSSTLRDYFQCIGLKANHGQNGGQMSNSNLNDYFGNRSNIHAFTQLDHNSYTGFYPQISFLDELHEVIPNSTLVFNFRPLADWIHSTTNWHGMRSRFSQFLMPGLVMTPKQVQRAKGIRDDVVKGAGVKLTDVQLAKWWCGHVLHIREYVQEYPSHALIELDLYDSNGTTSLLYDLFQADSVAYNYTQQQNQDQQQDDSRGSSVSCWGQSNKKGTQKQNKKRKRNKGGR